MSNLPSSRRETDGGDLGRGRDISLDATVYSAWRVEKEKLTELLHNPGRYAIEIGSFGGGTSRTLGIACQALGKTLICIDPWEDELGEQQLPRYLAAVADLGKSVITIRARSSQAIQLLPKDLPGNVCLLFIDGDHAYPQPLYDMEQYWPLVGDGGAMAIHDIFDMWWHRDIFRSLTEFFLDKPGYCLEAINYVPSKEESVTAKHQSSGLIWAIKGKTLL
jgi:hypothetical protein